MCPQPDIVRKLPAGSSNTRLDKLVFDDVDGKYILAELYLPGKDGFYLGSVLVEHRQVIINASR
jgi:hypothetical protein